MGRDNLIKGVYGLLLAWLLIYALVAPAMASPTVSFSGVPTSGNAPLGVTFTDNSTGLPSVFSWYFGDENWTAIGAGWTRMNASSGWPAREGPASVALPDGSIVLMGGDTEGSGGTYYNDTWLSGNKGATWSLVNASSGWSERSGAASVALPDGSIVLMGGSYNHNTLTTYYNDTWRSEDKGATWSLVNASSGWSERSGATTVALPDGSIVLMGGNGGAVKYNDTWRSEDKGATWSLVNASPGWQKRFGQTSAVLPDGNIILTGGFDGSSTFYNDTWKSVDNGTTWSLVNASSGWQKREPDASVALPDGSILLMGGYSVAYYNDTWRSEDKGATWSLVNAGSGWSERSSAASVALPDGSIVLMGGRYDDGSTGFVYNDTWRLATASSNNQNPTHTYTAAGTYPVSLGATNAMTGTGTLTKTGYISVSVAPVTVSSISPVAGVKTSSTPVTIAGTGFSTSGTTTVNLTRTGFTNISFTGAVASSTILTGTVPAHIPAGTWNVTVVNPDGREGTNASVTFTVTNLPPTTPTTTSTGSDTSSTYSDVSRPAAYTVNAPGAARGGTMTFAINEPLNVGGTRYSYAITSVSIVPSETLGSTDLIVTDAGTTSHAPDGRTVAGIVAISPVGVNPSVISSGTITFMVSTSWLEEHGLSPTNIVLMRLHDGAWAGLPTTCQYEAGGACSFTATTPGFSYFAIANQIGTASANVTVTEAAVTSTPAGAMQAAAVTSATPIPVKTGSSQNAEPVTTETTAVPAGAEGSTGIPALAIFAGIGGIAILAVGAMIGRRWWLRRQNPALFKKYN